MTDRYKKKRAGEPLQISAEVWNSFLDVVRALKEQRHNQLAGALEQIRQGDIVKLRNDSGADCDRFHVLGIHAPIISPSAYLREFQNQVALAGVIPRHPLHFARFAILLDPLRNGKIGRAWVSGVCPAYVDVVDPAHQFADVQDCDPTALMSRPVGSARILWREGGSGRQWAVVRLSNYAEDMRRFRLLEPLPRCGSASAMRVIYDGALTSVSCPESMPDNLRWCETDNTFTVYDSIGIVCHNVCQQHWVDSVPAGTYGWARWMPDSHRWEVVQLGEGCCESSSSESSESSSSESSESSSSSECSESWSSESSESWSSASSESTSSESSESASSESAESVSSESSESASSESAESVSSESSESASSESAESVSSESSESASSESAESVSSESSESASSEPSESASSEPSESASSEPSESASSEPSESASSEPSESASSESSESASNCVTIYETNVLCEDGRLVIMRRAVRICLSAGALSASYGPWEFWHEAGCCDCNMSSG